jgi:hypothetical protein
VIVSVRRLAVVAAGIGLLLALPGLVAGDGLPAPRPGATQGPSGDALRAVMDAHGLSCNPSQGINGEPELFCVRQASGQLTLTASFYTDPALVLVAGATGSPPLAQEGVDFLAELADLFCAADRAAMDGYVGGAVGGGSRPQTYDFTDATCELHTQVNSFPAADPPLAGAVLTAFALGPSGNPGTTPPPSGGTSGGAAQGPSSGAPFADSVATPARVSRDPLVLLESAGLAAAIVLLMPFPGQLFNSTLEEHEDEVRRWLRLDRARGAASRIGAFWSSWPGIAVFAIAAALLYGFLDPTFGADAHSAATFVGMLVAIAVVTLVFAIPAWRAHRRRGAPARLKVVPLSLAVAVVCVVISRLTGFQPGYLYGLLIGLAFAHELSRVEEGRATAAGAGVMLVAAGVAWLALGAMPAGDASFGATVLRTALAAITVAGLEGVVFGLLPFRFLPGEPVFGWNRVLWGLLLGVGAFAFLHILVNPASGYLADTSRTPLFTVVALLLGFSIVSVAFWAWFRFRAPPSAG